MSGTLPNTSSVKISEMNTAIPVVGVSYLPFLSTAPGDAVDPNKKVGVFDLPLSTAAQAALASKANTATVTGKLNAPVTAGTTGQALMYTSGGPVWGDIPTGTGGGNSNPGLNPVPVTLTDGATVPVVASADFYILNAGARASRVINKPTGVATGQAKQIIILFKQDSVGGRTVGFASGITAFGAVDPTANSVTRITLVTVDGGSTWIADGLGLAPGNDKLLATDATGTALGLDNVRQASFTAQGTPTVGTIYPLLMAPFAGKIRGLRTYIAVGSVNLTVKINTINVTGLTNQARDASSSNLVAATGANTFTVGQMINFIVNEETDLDAVWSVCLDLVQTA